MKYIFKEITDAFGALWKCRPVGDSLEITTPFPTSTSMYVTVFLTKRDDAWIVSDGGWVCNEIYNCELPTEEKIYNRVFDFFLDDYGIKITTSKNGSTYYYKGTRNIALVPNIVFDVANFVSNIVTTALIEFRPQNIPERFNTQVKNFLRENIDNERLKFNSPFSIGSTAASFGAIVSAPKGRVSLVNFVSGTSDNYLRNSFAKSNMNFDLLSYTSEKSLVDNKIVLIDNTPHIDFDKFSPIVDMCKRKEQIPLIWPDEKQELLDNVCA